MFRAIVIALAPLGLWAHAHPRAALLALAALVLLGVAVVKVLREFGPALAVASWGSPSRARYRWCPSCGGGYA
jgi:hypothetical protein